MTLQHVILLLLITSPHRFAKGVPAPEEDLPDDSTDETGFVDDVAPLNNGENETTTDETTEEEETTLKELDASDAPLIARLVVHAADRAVISYISHEEGMEGFPMTFMMSTSDGPRHAGKGVPYFYMTESNWGIKNILEKGIDCTVFMSKSQGGKCHGSKYPIEDYRCEHVLLTGKFEMISNLSAEYEDISADFFDRHPDYDNMELEDYFFTKFIIDTIFVYHDKNGPSKVSVNDYYEVDVGIFSNVLRADSSSVAPDKVSLAFTIIMSFIKILM